MEFGPGTVVIFHYRVLDSDSHELETSRGDDTTGRPRELTTSALQAP